MYRKSLTIIVLLALVIVNVSSAGQAISEDNTKIGILKSKVGRGEALTPEEEQIARDNGLFPASTNNTIGNSSRDVTTGGPDDFGYTWINSDDVWNPATYSWIDTAEATPIFEGALGDDYRHRVDIPFPFYYYGSWPDSVWITTNGWAGFSASYASSYWTNYPIPDDGYGPDNMACPLWDDWKAASATGSYHGTLYHKTTGNAPNRQFTLIWWELVRNWNNTTEYADSQYFSFQMILSEGTNNITFQYHDVTGYASADNGVGGTVGLENHDGSGGLQYEYNGVPQLVYDGMAIKFIAPEPLGPAPIFFSEYAEGSSNNKYLEIYNPTDGDVFLDDYVILGNYNGNPWSEAFTFSAGATIDTGSVYVIANASADSAILALADEVHAYADPWYTLAFNGNDVRALAQIVGGDTTILDIIGTLDGDGDGVPGEGSEDDPGDGFDVAGVTEATKDYTLVRKDEVISGNAGDWASSAGINENDSEWIVAERPTADYLPATLGWHMDANAPVPCTTNEVTFQMYDSYGDGWNGGTYTLTNEAGEVMATGGMTTDNCSDGGYASNDCNFAADILCLPNSAYGLVVGGGSWDSEITWDIVDSLGVVLASGGAPYDNDIYIGVPPPSPTLVVNEFLANSELCCDNGNGDSTDFIEIYNPGEEAVDIGGLWITDDLDSPAEWEQIPATNSTLTTVAAGGFIVIWTDEQQATGGALHTTDIKLSGDGEQIGLIYISGTDTVFVDSLSFGAQTQDISYGRDPDGSETWAYMSPPSPGITNFVCQDNEITFHMYDSYGDGWNGNVYTLVDALSGDTVGTGGLLTGSEGADEYCLPSGFYDLTVGGGSYLSEVSWEISMLSSVGVDSVFASGGAPFDATVNLDTTGTLGCMDPLALNYDASATLDDGSCFYIGDYCEFPITAVLDSNAASGSNQWFSYTAVSNGFLTATTCYAGQMEDTDLYVYDGCPAAGGVLIAESDDAQCDITDGNYYSSDVTFLSTPGQTYYFYWADTWAPGPFTWLLNFSPAAPYNLAATAGVAELGLSWNAYPLSEPEPTFMGTVGNSDDEQEAYETLTEKKALYASQTEATPSVTREDVRRKYASLPQTRDASVIFTLYDSWGDGYWGDGYIVTASSVADVDSIVYTAPGGNWGTESAHPVTLADGLYWVYFGYASFQSETTWDIVDAADSSIVYASGTAYVSADAPVYFAIGDYSVPMPDLTVGSIEYDYWSDEISVEVINLGDATAGSFDVKGYLTSPDNAGECNDYNYDLYANSQTLTGDDTLTISWTGIRAWLDANHPDSNPGGFGSYTFGFMADWGCIVSELDESNNSATQSVNVVNPLDLVVFNIYRQDSTEGFSMVGSVTGQTAYLDTGLVGDTEYCYQVSQIDYAGATESAASNVACGSPLPSGTLLAPQNFTGAANNWLVELTWDDIVPQTGGEEADFEDGVLPDGWSTTTNSAVGWYITEDATSSYWSVPGGDGFYAASNDDAANDDGSVDYLMMPPINIPDEGSTLVFSSYFNGAYSHTAHVEVSVDSGASFTEVYLVPSSDDWSSHTVDLGAYAGESNVTVAFHSNDNGGWASGWCVDNVYLGGEEYVGFAHFEGYNVYSGAEGQDELLGFTVSTNYSEYVSQAGIYTYSVTALYGIYGESDHSNYVGVDVTGSMVILYPPRNLTADVNGNDVLLGWDAPVGSPGWLSHSEGEHVTSIGTDGPSEFNVAQRFERGSIYDYDGMYVTQIEFIPNVATATYQPFIMEVPEGVNPDSTEYIVTVGQQVSGADLMMGQWNAVPIPPHQVDWNYELWFGYRTVTPEGYPAGTTAGPALVGYGDLIWWDGIWGSMFDRFELDYNWALGAFIENSIGQGDVIHHAFNIESLPYDGNGSTGDFTDNYDEVCPYSGSTSPDVVYSFTPAEDMVVNVDLCNSSYDTKVFIYENVSGNLAQTTSGEDACNDDFYSSSDAPCGIYTSAIWDIQLYADSTYWVIIDGYNGDYGDYSFTMYEQTRGMAANRRSAARQVGIRDVEHLKDLALEKRISSGQVILEEQQRQLEVPAFTLYTGKVPFSENNNIAPHTGMVFPQQSSRSLATLTEYEVWMDGMNVESVHHSQTEFEMENFELGNYSFWLYAIYEEGTSVSSDTVEAAIDSTGATTAVIEFRADMNLVDGWSSAEHTLDVMGSFNGWSGTSSVMTDAGDGQYVLTEHISVFPGTVLEWKFKAFPDEAFVNNGWEIGDNRTFIFSGDDQVLGSFNPNITIFTAGSDLVLGITESGGLPGDTVSVSVWTDLGDYNMYAYHIAAGFDGNLMTFLSADTIGSMTPSDWPFNVEPDDSGGVVIESLPLNTLTNPGFEELDALGNAVGWGSTHAGEGQAHTNIVTDSTVAHSGENYAHIGVDNGAAWAVFYSDQHQYTIPASAGETWRFSGYAKSVSGIDGDFGGFKIEGKDADGSIIEDSGEMIMPITDEWTLISADYIMPEGTVQATAVIVAVRYDGSNCDYLFDDMAFENMGDLNSEAAGVSGSGNLFNLSFVLSSDVEGGDFVDLFFTDVLLNRDENVILNTESGGVLALNYGDVSMNGSVTPFDASLILQSLVGSVELVDGQAGAGDVTQDASLSALDAAVILDYVLGLVGSLPVDESFAIVAGGDVGIPGGSVTPGDVFMMPIELEFGSNVRSFELEFSYDPEVLVYQSISWSDPVSGMTILDYQEDGLIKVSAAGQETIESGSTTLGWVEFELLDTFDDYQTTVTMSRSRLNEEDILIDGSAAVYTNALLVVDEWGNGGGVPQVFALKQNFPNPFNPLTQIRYQLPKESLVTIQIYDIMGRLVRSLVSGQKELTGYHQVTWDATNNSGDPVSAGMYLYVIQAGEFRETRKMVLMK